MTTRTRSTRRRRRLSQVGALVLGAVVATPASALNLLLASRHTLTSRPISTARLAVGPDGSALAAWVVAPHAGIGSQVFAQWLDPLGRPVGEPLALGPPSQSTQVSYSIDALAVRASGDAVVAVQVAEHGSLVPLRGETGVPIALRTLGCLRGGVGEVSLVTTASGYALACRLAPHGRAYGARWLNERLEPLTGFVIPDRRGELPTLAAGRGDLVVAAWRSWWDHRRALRWMWPDRVGPTVRLPSVGRNPGNSRGAAPVALVTDGDAGFLTLFSRHHGPGADEEETPIESARVALTASPRTLAPERQVGPRSCADPRTCADPRPLVDLALDRLGDGRYLASWSTCANTSGPGGGFCWDTGVLSLRVVSEEGGHGSSARLARQPFRGARGYTGARLLTLVKGGVGGQGLELRSYTLELRGVAGETRQPSEREHLVHLR